MPDSQGKPLPPLPDSAFDGERISTEVSFQSCKHTQVKYQGSELRCTCGAAWSGPNLAKLAEVLIKQ